MTGEQLNPKILGQLLIMQSFISNLPDKKSIFSFVCKGLLDIPGISKAAFYENSVDKFESLPLQVNFQILLGDSYFGELVIRLSNVDLYKPYEDYLKNFIFMIGVVLEERNLRQLNEQHQQLLEQRILERTQELKEKAEEIESQNEEYLQINEELNQINEELHKAKEKAEESDRLKTAFLQNMSHEIRTPMNAIMGFSDLMKNEYNDKTKLERFAGIISQRCNDLLDIINDILDIAKIESGQLSIKQEECNLNSLFEELTSFFTEYQKRIDKLHIKFSLNALCDQTENRILTDKVKLKQIFINLISNAFKFTDEGKIEGGCKFDDNHVLIFYVADTGMGIPTDKQQLIFERFIQLNPGANKLVSGTGLGLSIVKGLVSLLGGEIFLDSEPGKGSTFSFSIPYNTAQSLQNDSSLTEKFIHLSSSKKTILIVEDDIYNAEYLKELFSSSQLDILCAKNGKEAIELSITQSIDLVLMDIRLPDINGYEATRQIQQFKPNLKIIAQTAFASIDEPQKAFDAGCIDYISKPTKKDMLLSMINKYLTQE